MTDLRPGGEWRNRTDDDDGPVVGDLISGLIGVSGAGASRDGVSIDDEPSVDGPVDLDLTDGDAATGDGDPAGANDWSLRALKMVALVGVAGWVLVVAVNLLSPSNLLDTTDDDEAEPPVPESDAFTNGVGGGAGQAGVDAEDAASVLRVGGDDGSVAAPDSPDGVGVADQAAVDIDGGAASGSEAGQGDSMTATSPAPAEVGSGAGSAAPAAVAGSDYRSNLAMLRGATVRNRTEDASPQRDVAQVNLVLAENYGPRNEYLGNPGGNPEQSFPVAAGGQFRTSCEFSHFGYDDPLVFPGQAGASHLHMFFGNTDVNAFTTHDTLINSGSSTCNGQELNRTGYWVPAMFDGQGNVRVPERVVVYYKGEGLSRGASEPYPAGAAMIASDNLNTASSGEGGVGGKKMSYVCSDNFSTNTGQGSQTMPGCNGSAFAGDPGRWTVLEMNVKFPQCWNGAEPSNIDNFSAPAGDWYGSNCSGEYNHNLPNLEYFVNYRVDPGEDTSSWFLSSDIDPTSFGTAKATGGSTVHADWWGGWHPDINQMWIDNCVNYRGSAPSGCGMGYLSDGGANGSAPGGGAALQFRTQYAGPNKVAASTLFAELCPSPMRPYSRPEDAAYCRPG